MAFTILNGTRFDERLVGTEGADFIQGLDGADLIKAGRGDDSVYGGAGDDTLVGGTGADIFIVRSAHGVDTITDFAAGDVLRVTANVNGLGLSGVEDLAERITLDEDGAWIDLGGGNGVCLLGIEAGDLPGLVGEGLVLI